MDTGEQSNLVNTLALLPAECSHQPLCQLSTLSWVMDGDRQTGAPLGNLAQLSWTHADLWTPAFL